MHEWLARYARYSTHVTAYVCLLADPYPKFRGWPGTYPVDLRVDPPVTQSRWKIGFRLPLAIPAIVFAYVLAVVLIVVAILSWFVALAVARVPSRVPEPRDVLRPLPGADSGVPAAAHRPLPDACERERLPVRKGRIVTETAAIADRHPIGLIVDDDLRRNRLTVFFRLLLAIPQLIWLYFFGIVAAFALLFAWIVALFTGRVPDALHNLLARYQRLTTHVAAYTLLIADPWPPFGGSPGTYPGRPARRRSGAAEPTDGVLPRAARDPGAPPRLRLPPRQHTDRRARLVLLHSSSGACTKGCAI